MAARSRLFLACSFILLYASALHAQGMGTITGRVIDGSTQQPIAGANVIAGGRNALTGADGRFAIASVPVGTQSVRVTLLGYREATQRISLEASQTLNLDIALTPEAVELGELVVIGYGQQRARALTGSVQSVSAAEFNKGRVVSPEQLITGKVSGVHIVDSGEPGSGVNIRIRGGTSVTSSNEPLFVVDGVPLAIGGGLTAGCSITSCNRSPLNFINPNDIANITVLKDASATAIYGSRGANGVVIIDTKTGARSGQLTYTGSVSASNVTRQPDVLTAAQFRAAVQQYAPANTTVIGSANTDWLKAVQRSGYGQDHNVAFAASAGSINYRLSLGYLNQEGIIQGSNTERISGSLNYDQSLLADRLTVRANVKGSRMVDLFTPGGVLGGANAFAPTQPITDPASPYGGYFEWDDHNTATNPVAELALSTDEGTTYRTIGNVQGEYRLPFISDLSATVNVGYDLGKTERKKFYPSYLRWQAKSALPGQFERENYTQTATVADAYLRYAKSLLGADDDRLELTGGYSYEYSRGDFPRFVARGLSSDLLGPNGLPAAEEVTPFMPQIEEAKLASLFARANYSLRDQYFLTLSVRRDGSSRFGVGNQWGTFPAVAVAWRLSNDLVERAGPLSDLKLRGSWGVNGNQAFANYQQYSTYLFGDSRSQAQFGDEFVTTIRPSAADPNIKWEETTSTNFGADFALFNNRVSGTFDFYNKRTDDLIFNVPVAAGSNLTNFVTTNIGDLKNRGFEFSIGTDVINRGRAGLTWNASFNASTNKNELVRINAIGAGNEQILTGNDISGGIGNKVLVLQPGHPINSFFVYQHRLGPDGRPLYADRNNDGNITDLDLYEDLNNDGVVNQNDRRVHHDAAPDWMFGHTSLINFKQLDASFTLRAQIGNYVYNNVASNQGHYGALARQSPVNLHASVLETSFMTPQYYSDYYVEDGSFLKMDNITVGYTLNNFRGMQSVRVYGAVQNVFTMTGYSGIDPTAGIDGVDNNIYPRSRTFSAGVSVGF